MTMAEVNQKMLTCSLCGLAFQRLYSAETGKSEIPAVEYLNRCKLAPQPPAFDFRCPKLQEAIDAAIREERASTLQ
jgi:hypothetical protein